MSPDKILIYAQIVIQIFLVLLVILLILRDRQRSVSSQALDNLKKLLGETQKINEEFADAIQQKTSMVQQLMDELENRMQAAQNLKTVLGSGGSNKPPEKSHSTADVLRLSKDGHDALEISRITGIPVGEVHLMIKLAGQSET